MRGVFLHVMADALGSVIVIISALVMWQAPDWRFAIYVDPGIYDFSIRCRVKVKEHGLHHPCDISCILILGLSLIMVMLMMWSVWPLLIESALILLQTVPTHIDIEKLKRKLLENIDGILAVSTFRNIENAMTVYIFSNDLQENTELELIYYN